MAAVGFSFPTTTDARSSPFFFQINDLRAKQGWKMSGSATAKKFLMKILRVFVQKPPFMKKVYIRKSKQNSAKPAHLNM